MPIAGCVWTPPDNLFKKWCPAEKVAAAPRGGRRTAIAVAKATSTTGGGRYPGFFNRLLFLLVTGRIEDGERIVVFAWFVPTGSG